MSSRLTRPAVVFVLLLALACGSDALPPAQPAATITPAIGSDGPVSPPTPESRPGRGGLWIYDDQGDGLIGLSMRVVPGANPDVDAWRFEPGPYSPSPDLSCAPRTQADGWQFADCGDRTAFSAFMPRAGENGFAVAYGGSSGRRTEAELSRVEERGEAQASNVTLRWQHAAPAGARSAGIWAGEGLVFVPVSTGVIEIIDAASGELLGTADLSQAPMTGRGSGDAFEVTARGDFLYVGGLTKGLVVFNVADPRRPRFTGQYSVDAGAGSRESFTNIHNLFLSPHGDLIYAINQSHPATDLRIIEVSDPARPREVGRFSVRSDGPPLGGQHDIEVIERGGRLIAFLNHLSDGLYVLDITDPSAVRQLSHVTYEGIFSHAGASFERNGRLYYAHTDEGFDAGLTVFDVTDLSAPREVSRFRTRRGISLHNIEIADGIAYVSYYGDGLRVIDLRDPANPREIGHYDTVPPEQERGLFQGAWGVGLTGGHVYISDIENGVFSFDVALPR